MARTCRIVGIVAVVSSLSSSALAQRLEVGGSIGLGMPGSEGSLISAVSRGVSSLHASVWWGDHLETAIRVAWLELSEPTRPTVYIRGCGTNAPPDCQRQEIGVFFRADNPRRYTAVEFLYHARPGARVRPFVGGGIGIINTSVTSECEVAGCEALLWFPLGRRTSSAQDPIGVVGVSGTVWRHLVLRGALHFHRPGGEALSLFELAFMAGYRF